MWILWVFQGLLQGFLDKLLQAALIFKSWGVYENPSRVLIQTLELDAPSPSDLSLGSEAQSEARSSVADFEEGLLHEWVQWERMPAHCHGAT